MNELLLDQPVSFLQLQQSFKDSYIKGRKYRCVGGAFFVISICTVVINLEDVIPGCDDHPSVCSYVPLWLFLCSWAVMMCSCARACRQEDLQQRAFEKIERSLQDSAIADGLQAANSSKGETLGEAQLSLADPVGLVVPGIGAD